MCLAPRTQHGNPAGFEPRASQCGDRHYANWAPLTRNIGYHIGLECAKICFFWGRQGRNRAKDSVWLQNLFDASVGKRLIYVCFLRMGIAEYRRTEIEILVSTVIASLEMPDILIYEPPHGKTNNLHRRKQRRRSASR